MKRLLLLLLLSLSAPCALAQGDVADLLACMRGNVPSEATVSRVEVTTIDHDSGESQRFAGRIYAARKNGTGEDAQLWAMLRVDAPEHLAGAAYLVREVDDSLRDEMFVYLPAVGRVRRITGSFADTPLLGTTFSYFDFKQLWNAFGDLSPASIGATRHIDGRSARVLHLQPRPDSQIAYTAVTVWVDQRTCLPLRAEFKHAGKLLKRFTAPAAAIAQSQGRWYLSKLHMHDLEKNSDSEIAVENLTTIKQPAHDFFDPETFNDAE